MEGDSDGVIQETPATSCHLRAKHGSNGSIAIAYREFEIATIPTLQRRGGMANQLSIESAIKSMVLRDFLAPRRSL
jgi:hypothetical protein